MSVYSGKKYKGRIKMISIRQLRKAAIPAVVLCVIAALWSCEPGIYEPQPRHLPISNQRVIEQTTQPATSSFYDLYEDGITGFYFLGNDNNGRTMGTIDRAGQIGWAKSAENRVQNLFPVPANSIGLDDAVLSAGGIDSNSDGQSDKAFVRLTGANGIEISEILFSRSDAAVWLNSIDALGPLGFVAVGGSYIVGVYHPFVATFGIGADSILVLNNEVILSDVNGQYFGSVQVDAEQVSGDDFVCYVAAGVQSSGGSSSIAIHSMTGSTTDSDAFDFTWTVDIALDEPLSIWSYVGRLILHDGAIYLVGSADVEKENVPSGGGYWDAGFVASVSTIGTMNWLNIFSVSTHSERYYGLYVADNRVYAAGKYDSYVKTSSGEQFGLAVISIFDAMTGDEIYHIGLGAADYASAFNSLIVEGTRAYCCGMTNHFTNDAGYQAWFAEVTINDFEGAPRSGLPASLPVVEGEVPPPASREQTGMGLPGGICREI